MGEFGTQLNPSHDIGLKQTMAFKIQLLGILIPFGTVSLLLAQSNDSMRPIVSSDVVFEEHEGVLAVEAEYFYRQSKTEKRAWHLHSTTINTDIKPDGDPPHLAKASGFAYLESLPDTRRTHADKLIHGENFSNEPGKVAILDYRVWINKLGRYYVWVRAFSTGTEDNGIHVGLDGTWPESGRRLQWTAKRKWYWDSKQRTAKVHTGVPGLIFLDIKKKGLHTISFSMREDGFEFDKWLMTLNKDFERPNADGPATRLRTGKLPKPFPPAELKRSGGSKSPTTQRASSSIGIRQANAVSVVQDKDTLPPEEEIGAIDTFEKMWTGFDPRLEPLEVETLKEWTEQGVHLKIVRFRVGRFKGKVARLAAIYGFPADRNHAERKVPGLVQIHGGGQYADYKACLANAKRGYATVSIAWAGRISAPGYRVSPAEVKLYWDNKTDHPNFRKTTDWGNVDGYHAPSRNPGNVFPSGKPGTWTLDKSESPRNSGWFLSAIAARRAITFLERRPEVDPERIGVYGHSMGGKLTVLTSIDNRVKAAAPSCGGISDRYNRSELFNKTLGDHQSLKKIKCPIVFLSPANDFHGRIGDLPSAIQEIKSREWRVTCSPHHNHQDTPPHEVATMLWFDQHLKNSFRFPATPQTQLKLSSVNGTPQFDVTIDNSRQVKSVEVYYSRHGKIPETPSDIENAKHRFWHFLKPSKSPSPDKKGELWTVQVPLTNIDQPLWIYANVVYELDKPVKGVGYYYGDYEAETLCISSVLTKIPSERLRESSAKPIARVEKMIEDFQGDWKKEWFTYRPDEWPLSTNKLYSAVWKAPENSKLTLKVKAASPNELLIRLDSYIATVKLKGGDQWQQISLKSSDFKNFSDQPLADWNDIKLLKLASVERLRPPRGQKGRSKVIGRPWKGTAPEFQELRWR